MNVVTGLRLGTWVKLATPQSVEILADAGFDFVVIDLEHTLLGPETVQSAISLAAALGVRPLVRVPDHRASTFQRVLDAGAAGVVVPHVDSAEQARAVAGACRFPPHGTRGTGSTGAAGHWGRVPRAEYLRRGNEDVACIVQIESAAAVRAAEQIAAVEGVDAVFLGAADLALDVGSDDVSEELDRARRVAAAAGVACGSATGTAAGATAAFARGDAFVVCSNDTSLLAGAAAETVRSVRDAAPRLAQHVS